MEKNTGSKQKIAEYLKYKGISLGKFSIMCAVSESFLRKGDNLGSDKLKIISENFPELNMYWVLGLQKNMLIDENKGLDSSLNVKKTLKAETDYVSTCKNCEEVEKRLVIQSQFIDSLTENNKALIQQLNGKG